MILKPNEKITEDHFMGTFIFPDDLDFYGDTVKTDFFCDVFNEMINQRIKVPNHDKTTAESK